MSNVLNILYRISDAGYKKEKPEYINNINCLKNFIESIGLNPYEKIYINVFLDNCSYETKKLVTDFLEIYVYENFTCDISYLDKYFEFHTHDIKCGSSAKSFKHVFDFVLNYLDDDTHVYFVENDYLHKSNFQEIIFDAIKNLKANYVTLYDHPDKYIYGANPEVKQDGGEITKVYLGKNCHFKLTNSTTMTFATTVIQLKKDYDVINKYISEDYPQDYLMFKELIKIHKRSLLSPIPGYSTHGETKWLSPLTNWQKIGEKDVKKEMLF